MLRLHWYVVLVVLCIVALAALSIGCGQKPTEKAPPAKAEKAQSPVQEVKKPEAEKTETQPAVVPPGKDEEAPEDYTVKLETTKGEILLDVHKAWAPLGADRFYTLVKTGFFTDVAFFRVIAGFMAQVGLSGDPAINREWRYKSIQDDPVVQSNTRGMVSFATSGPNSRTTQFFINLGDNSRLDSTGFSPFGKVRDMEVVEALYSGYGEGAPKGNGPSQQRIHTEGKAYLEANFPELDYIKSAEIL